MSADSDIATGIVAGAVITYAVDQANLPPSSTVFIGGGSGLVLAIIPTSRQAGIAMMLSSLFGAAIVSSQKRRLRTASSR